MDGFFVRIGAVGGAAPLDGLPTRFSLAGEAVDWTLKYEGGGFSGLARGLIPWGYMAGMEMKGSGSTRGVDSRGSPLRIGMVTLPV